MIAIRYPQCCHLKYSFVFVISKKKLQWRDLFYNKETFSCVSLHWRETQMWMSNTCLQLKMKKHYFKTWNISPEHVWKSVCVSVFLSWSFYLGGLCLFKPTIFLFQYTNIWLNWLLTALHNIMTNLYLVNQWLI